MNSPFDEEDKMPASVGFGSFLLGIALAEVCLGILIWHDAHRIHTSHYGGPHLEGVVYFMILLVGAPICGSIPGALLTIAAFLCHRRGGQGYARVLAASGYIALPLTIAANLIAMRS
jgi:hypothetical protein